MARKPTGRPPGAPLGNKNASKNKPVSDVMRIVVTSAEGQKKLRVAATRILARAVKADLAAYALVRDTVEGKPKETVEVEGGENLLAAFARMNARRRKDA
jgi:hypothetical protein